MSQSISRLEASERLKAIMNKRRGRIESTLNWAIGVGENLHSRFDDITHEEIKTMREQLEILEVVGEDMQKEKTELEAIAREVETAYASLDQMLSDAKQGKIKSIFDCLPSIMQGFQTLGKIQELVEKVDRWSRSFTRHVDTINEIVDRRLRSAT